MRILFCNYEYPPLGGGGGIVMAALARELVRRGHDVTVLTSRAAGLGGDCVQDGVKVVRVPVLFRRKLAVANFPSMAAYLPSGFWRGVQLARKAAFDVINTHFAVPTGPVGEWLAYRLRVPNVLSVHGGDLFDPSKRSSPHRHPLIRFAVSGLLRRADLLVAQSQDTARHVSDIYGIRRHVEIIPLGIERPPENVRACRSAFDVPDNAFVAVAVGRMVARKATIQLIHMLAAAAIPDMYLLLVGDGPELGAVRRCAQQLGVASRLRLLGHVPEDAKFRALRAADLFVSSSQHEGFGLVFLEAMAFGLPIVCYDRGGQTDFLTNDATGRIVALNDLAGLTSAVLDLYRSPARRLAMGRNNLLAARNFYIDVCARRYEAIFERAIIAGSESLAAAGPK